MKIARVATRQVRESAIANGEAIMSTEIADKGRAQTSAFVGIRICLFYFAVWAVSCEGTCLF